MHSKKIHKILKKSVGEWLLKIKVDADHISFKDNENTDHNIFTCCFSLFILDLLKFTDNISLQTKIITADYIKSHQDKDTGLFYPDERRYDIFSKIPQQLTCFCLSALKILNEKPRYEIKILENFQNSSELISYLDMKGCKEGYSGSGNFALFIGVFLTHELESQNNNNYQKLLDSWFEYHEYHQNRMTGFWGPKPYFQFQNAYHQLELFNYHNRQIPNIEKMVDNILFIQTSKGTFSPMGMGPCWNYDAANILANAYKNSNYRNKEISNSLKKLRKIIIKNKGSDGGFSDLNQIGKFPQSLINYPIHLLDGGFNPKLWELRIEETLKRVLLPFLKDKKNLSKSSWAAGYHKLNTSNLWDTWFSLLIIGIIEEVIFSESNYRYIDKIGIGFFKKR